MCVARVAALCLALRHRRLQLQRQRVGGQRQGDRVPALRGDGRGAAGGARSFGGAGRGRWRDDRCGGADGAGGDFGLDGGGAREVERAEAVQVPARTGVSRRAARASKSTPRNRSIASTRTHARRHPNTHTGKQAGRRANAPEAADDHRRRGAAAAHLAVGDDKEGRVAACRRAGGQVLQRSHDGVKRLHGGRLLIGDGQTLVVCVDQPVRRDLRGRDETPFACGQ